MYLVDPLRRSICLARDESGLGTWLFPLAIKKTNAEHMKNACVKYKWCKSDKKRVRLIVNPFPFFLRSVFGQSPVVARSLHAGPTSTLI